MIWHDNTGLLQGRAAITVDSPWHRNVYSQLCQNLGNGRFSCIRVSSPDIRRLGLLGAGSHQRLFLEVEAEEFSEAAEEEEETSSQQGKKTKFE